MRHQAGGDGGFEAGERPEEEEEIFSFFSSACFSGYGDDARVSQRAWVLLLPMKPPMHNSRHTRTHHTDNTKANANTNTRIITGLLHGLRGRV